VWDQG
jgi:PAS domain S-box-containing protein